MEVLLIRAGSSARENTDIAGEQNGIGMAEGNAKCSLSFLAALSFTMGFYAVVVGEQQTPLTHDGKVDILVGFHDNCALLVQTILEVSKGMQDGVPEAEKDLSELKFAQDRMTYETDVMQHEHNVLMLTTKRSAVTDEREAAIVRAKENITNELVPKLKDTTARVEKLMKSMSTTTLDPASIKKIQDEANAALNNTDEPISIPTAADTKARIEEEITKVMKVINTLSSPTKDAAVKLTETVRTKFDDLLDEKSGKNFEELSVIAKEIDTALVQIRQLDILGSQARMEL